MKNPSICTSNLPLLLDAAAGSFIVSSRTRANWTRAGGRGMCEGGVLSYPIRVHPSHPRPNIHAAHWRTAAGACSWLTAVTWYELPRHGYYDHHRFNIVLHMKAGIYIIRKKILRPSTKQSTRKKKVGYYEIWDMRQECRHQKNQKKTA